MRPRLMFCAAYAGCWLKPPRNSAACAACPPDSSALNARLEAAPFSQRLEAAEDGRLRLGLVPCNRDPAWFSACVVRSFALLLTEYAPERLKCCANPECGWFFYDESKNQTRKVVR